MSDSEKDPKNPLNDLADALSGFDLGPKWAQDTSDDSLVKKYEKASQREERGGDRRGGGRNDRRGGGNFGGRDGGGQRRGGDRRDFKKGGQRQRRPMREEVVAPDYLTAELMALEPGVDGLAKEIAGTGRTYSVFDLAKFVLESRDRFRVIFQSNDSDKPLYHCSKDQALFLTRSEAIDHVLKADWLPDFYNAEDVEAEAPSGNFPSVAKCGFSGEWLGPPNFHTYQTTVARLHRERFSHMSLERYKARIVIEKDEESIAAWLESMKTKIVYRVKSAAPEESEEKAEEPPEEKTTATVTVEEAAAEEAPQMEEELSEEAAIEELAPAAEEGSKGELLADLAAVQAHFLENHFDSVFKAQERGWVPGGIPAKLLSPGILTLLKSTVSEEKRYPGKLGAFLCRQFTGRHLAVFKFKGKLKSGPARPRAVPVDLKLAERPEKILAWVKENSGQTLDGLWKTCLGENPSDDDKKPWYADLHWVLNQGYVLLLEDGTLHLSKNTQPAAAPKSEEKGNAPAGDEASKETESNEA